MTFVRIQFRMQGEALVDREMDALDERLVNVSAAWPQVVATFREIVHRAFETEGKSTGKAWAPLAKSTESERVRLGYAAAHPILKRTGELESSLTGGGGGFIEASPQRLAIGSNDPIFPFHQSNQPRTRLPRRAPVLLTDADRTALVQPIRLHMTGRDPSTPQRARPTS